MLVVCIFYVEVSYFAVVLGGVGFCEVVGVVGFSRAPDNDKVFLVDAVTDPVVSHVDCFRSALFDGAICDPDGALVVTYDRCGALGVSEVGEGVAEDFGCDPVHEHGGVFCLHG